MSSVLVRIGATTLAAVILGAAPAPTHAQFADSITVTELAEELYLLEGALDLIVVSVGEDGTLMVDAGYPETEEIVREALARIGAGAPDILINTHWHHTFANGAFGEEATVIAHRTVSERGRRANRMFDRLVPALPERGLPEVLVQDSLALRFNGREIHLLHLPGAHTDGDLAVVFRDAGVVMTGDVAVPHLPWTDSDNGGRFERMLEAVDLLRDVVLPEAVIVPGHGPPFGHATLDAYARMLRETAERVQERIARGWALEDVLEEGLPERWRGWEAAVPESVFLASVYRAYGPEDGTAPPPPIRFDNGRWWDGERFRSTTWYSVGGRLTRAPPTEIDRVLNLGGGFVVPAFGEAHTHRFGGPARLEEDHRAFLNAGVFYAMVQDPADTVGTRARELSESVAGVDVVYTQGVVTPSWGVIPRLYAMLVEMGRYGPEATQADVRDRLYFEVDDAADLAAKWPAIRDANGAFVKVILAFSEEHHERRAHPVRFGAELPRFSALPGLDPTLLPELVRRAHDEGLRISAHVETAADLRLAAESDVDLIAHLPASWQIGPETGIPPDERSRWLLREEDARAVHRSGAVVITTALPPPDRAGDPTLKGVHRHNLEVLRKAGARLALGSDAFEGTVLDELAYLAGLDIFRPAELVNLLTRDTPRAIFPGRRIGELAEGFEASFVVLDADPTTNLAVLRHPRLLVKEGRLVPSNVPES